MEVTCSLSVASVLGSGPAVVPLADREQVTSYAHFRAIKADRIRHDREKVCARPIFPPESRLQPQTLAPPPLVSEMWNLGSGRGLERGGNNLPGFQDFHMKAKAIIWPNSLIRAMFA